MGQRQSAQSGDESDNAPLKQDYYELLGLQHDASEDDIKKAYRRKALELHPDRNYGDEEGATKLFAEVQAAYEILSDPQERAWYDSHRDILLRGDATSPNGPEFSYNVRMTSAEEVLKLMLQFNKKVEYTDAPSGFFGGLNDFFKQLAKEEDAACQWQGLDQLDYPEFGSEHDQYEDVVRPFYAAWAGFATKKSYSWKDQYRLQDAPDRRIRRLMEKENQKLRDEAIQEFNDAVRSLTAFVRKRDPRVQNNQKSEAERQKALRDLAAAQAVRARTQRQKDLEQYENTVIPAWAQSNFKDEHEGGFSSESEEERHEYDCVVCDKTFRSEAQFHVHERSKKHLKLLKELKKDMRKQGQDLGLTSQDVDETTPQNQSDLEIEHEAKAEYSLNAKSLSSHRHSDEDNASEAEHAAKESNDQSQATPDVSDPESEMDEYAPRSAVLNRFDEQDLEATENLSKHTESIALDGDTPVASEPDTGSLPKLNKAKQKKAKKAAQLAASQQNSQDYKCAVCEEPFPSKTKLFKHIADEGHAAPLSQTKPTSKSGRGKKR